MMLLPMPPNLQNDPFLLAMQQNNGLPPTPQQITAAQIDTAAVSARSQVITSTLGQDWEYHAKLSEARQYLSDGYQELEAYPYLAAMVEETEGEAEAIAEGIIDAATASNAKRARIEAVRTAAKERLRSLDDEDHEEMQHEIEDAQQRMQQIAAE